MRISGRSGEFRSDVRPALRFARRDARPGRLFALCVSATMLLLSSPVPYLSQQQQSPLEIRNTCGRCVVALEHVRTLGSSGPSMVERRPTGGFRTPRGDVILYQLGRPRVQVFDSLGRSRGLLARVGPGPGEFERPLWISPGTGDTVRVYERKRVVVFGPRLQYVRDVTLKTPIAASFVEFVRLSNGMTAHIPNGGQPGDQKRLNIRRSNGDTVVTPVLPDTVGPINTYQLAAGHGRAVGVWYARGSMDSAGYQVGWVDTTGRRTQRFKRIPGWWHHTPKPEPFVVWRVPKDGGRPVASRDSSDRLPRPATMLRDFRVRQDGRLLVLVEHPREPWEGMTLRNVAWAAATSTVMEVIDPTTNTVVGSAGARGSPIGFLSDEVLATYREDADGAFHVELWRITVRVDSGRDKAGGQ